MLTSTRKHLQFLRLVDPTLKYPMHVYRDGKLNYHEFCIAMHLTSVAKTGLAMPDELPPHLEPSYLRGEPVRAFVTVSP